MTGAVDGGFTGVWQIVKPTGTTDTNYVTNPSFETNTTGWTATSATFTRTAGAGAFGAYGGRLLASGTNGKASTTLASVTSGTSGVASAYIKAASALVQLKVTIGASSGTQTHTGDGLWHRIEVPLTAPSTTTPVIEIIDTRTSAWTNVDIDGVQFETGVTAATTYIDGDQDGCIWSGTAHGSNSTRDGRDPRGGQILSLASLGLTETTWGGIGAPDVDVATLTRAKADGEIYQNSTAKPRVFTLSALSQATNLVGLHAARRALMNALAPDIRTNRGPVRLRYSGAADPKYIDAVNESGFGFDKAYHQRAEMAEMRFLAPDPMWRGETEQSSVLTAAQTLTPVHGFAQRLSNGSWSTLAGGPAASTSFTAFAIQLLDGRIVIGGTSYVDFGGVTTVDILGVWDGAAWANLGGTAPNSAVQSAALGSTGVLYVGGDFTAIGGVAINRMAQWTPSTNVWTTVGTGGANSNVLALAVDPGTGYLWAAGGFGTIGGVAASGMAYWNGSIWTAATSGLPGGWAVAGPQSLIVGPDGRIYVGLSVGSVYVWTGSAWAVATTTTGAVYCLLSANGRLYVGGAMTVIGGVTVAGIAMSGGSGWSSMAGGLAAGGVRSLASTPDGLVYAAGDNWTTIGGITPPDSMAAWSGSAWAPFPADPPNTGTHTNDIYNVYGLRDGSLIASWWATSGTFGTTLTAEAITSVTNSSSANAYPVFEFDSSTAVYTLANLTTGHRISFSGAIVAGGEIARLDLRPGRKTFSTLLRNMISTVLPGSDLATFCLAPGVNQISLYAAGGNNAVRWSPRYWSAD